MIAPPTPQSIYLGGAPEPVFAVVHSPAPDAPRDTAVLICPPFGWDEVSSYRSRREWAQRLSQAGYLCVRISLPGTGDSGGSPRDAGQLEAWTAAVSASVHWLRETGGARRTATIGIGLGGLLACRAAAQGAPIDDLVLWATPSRGRSFVRELRAFARLEASDQVARDEPLSGPQEGTLVAGGFLLSPETIDSLERLDITELAMHAGPRRRALLLGRDGLAVDPALREHLKACGVTIDLGAGRGYGAMVAPPQQARAPRELIDQVTAWLDGAAGESKSIPSLAAGDLTSAPIVGVRDSAIREAAFAVAQPFGQISGILTQPLEPAGSDLCAVLLNAGAIRRIGPNRMWVEAARRWAARGVPTLRLDVEGIGDADGDAAAYIDDAGLYVPQLVDQVVAALDVLQEQGVGSRFVLGGLCSGAYWSFEAVRRDARVVAALMLNPRALIWDPGLGPGRDFRRGVLRPSKWHRINELPPARMKALARWSLASPTRIGAGIADRARRRPTRDERLGDAFNALCESEKRAVLAFSHQEPLHQELERSGLLLRLQGSPCVTVADLPGRLHELRSVPAQQRAHEVLDSALELELRSAGP